MSVKEFSQKNSLMLFYTTVVLIIIVIALSYVSLGHRNFREMNRTNFQGNRQQGTMQRVTNTSNQNTQDNSLDQLQDQNATNI